MNKKTKSLVLAGLLTAITLVLGLTPIGIIPLGFINVTIMCLPVIIGTLFSGLRMGLLLGAVFGACSALSAFGMSLVPQSALAQLLLGVNPLYVVALCLLPRMLIPLTTHLVYKALFAKHAKLSLGVAAAVGSLTNTFGYLGLMLAFFSMAGLNSQTVLGIIFGTGAIAGSCEAAVAVIVTVPVVSALSRTNRKPLNGGEIA